MKERCNELCPKRNLLTYELLQSSCDNPRIKLEAVDSGIDEDNRPWEVAKVVCGAAQFKAETEEDPTLDINDFEESPLTIGELRELHAKGMLPEQFLD